MESVEVELAVEDSGFSWASRFGFISWRRVRACVERSQRCSALKGNSCVSWDTDFRSHASRFSSRICKKNQPQTTEGLGGAHLWPISKHSWRPLTAPMTSRESAVNFNFKKQARGGGDSTVAAMMRGEVEWADCSGSAGFV